MPNTSSVSPPDLQPADPDLHIAALPARMGTGLRVRGELDLAAEPALRAAVSAACRSQPARASDVFVLDLTDVTFMDCTALRALNAAHARVARHGWELHVIPPTARGPYWLLQFGARAGWLVQLCSDAMIDFVSISERPNTLIRQDI